MLIANNAILISHLLALHIDKAPFTYQYTNINTKPLYNLIHVCIRE